MTLRLPLIALAFAAVGFSDHSHAEPDLDQCPAEKYTSCSSFMTSVEIGEREPIIDNHLAGFTRSRGAWKISVRYHPETECAKVNILLDMGPLDVPRQYRKVLRNGGGVISDSGTFMHRIDDVETALRIPSSSCHVPDPEASKEGAAAEDGETLDEERERLALAEERERLALDRERGRLELENERDRLVVERERLALAQELDAAERRRRLERERDRRRRLAEQQRQEDRERQPLVRPQQRSASAELRSTIALLRERAEREQERRRADKQAATDAMLTGLTMGLIGGVLEMAGEGSGGSFNPGALAALQGGGGTDCDRIGQRLARELESMRSARGNSMCGMGLGMARALSRARSELSATNCASGQELAEMDRSIRQAQASARASCE